MYLSILVVLISPLLAASGPGVEAPALIANPTRSTNTTLDTAKIAQLADSLMQAHNVPSYAVGVVQGDDLVYASGFGVANRKSRKPATPQTLYQLGSVSKVFTATLMVALRDDGLLALDDPVRKYLPAGQNFPRGEDGAELTLRHLATHTSGLPRDFVNRVNVDPPGGPGVARAYSVRELYAGLDSTEITGSIGDYRYSNMNFGLLGHLLERAAGKPYELLLRQRILEPLGMRDTFVHVPEEKQDLFATAYWEDFGPETERDPWFFGEICGHAGLTSNVVDLAKFVSWQFRTDDNGSSPLTRASIRELWTPQSVEMDNGKIGLGWHIRELDDSGEWVAHGGEVDGFSSVVAFKPKSKIGVIVLTNFGGNTAFRLAVPVMKIAAEMIDAKD